MSTCKDTQSQGAADPQTTAVDAKKECGTASATYWKSVGTVSVQMCCGTVAALFTPTQNYLHEDNRGRKYALFVAEGDEQRGALLRKLKHAGVPLELCCTTSTGREQRMSALALAAVNSTNVEVCVVGGCQLQLKCVTIPAPTKS